MSINVISENRGEVIFKQNEELTLKDTVLTVLSRIKTNYGLYQIDLDNRSA